MGVIKPLSDRNVLLDRGSHWLQTQSERGQFVYLASVLTLCSPKCVSAVFWFISLLILTCLCNMDLTEILQVSQKRYFQTLGSPLSVVLNGGFPLDFHLWIGKKIMLPTLHSLWNRRQRANFKQNNHKCNVSYQLSCISDAESSRILLQNPYLLFRILHTIIQNIKL